MQRQLSRCLALTWYLAVYVVRGVGIVNHARRVRESRGVPEDLPFGVTILRPMKGVEDADLYECLRRTFVQTHQPLEIIMCVADPDDPAVKVANRLIKEHPDVDARVLTGPDQNQGVNPKVNNLVKGYKAAKYDMIWVLDSNVLVHPDALRRALPLFEDRRIQLVHHLPVAVAQPGAGWGGMLDEVYMLTAHSTFYSGINAFAIAPCVTGKSNIYRRSALDANTAPGEGLEYFSKYMAEDQMISEALWDRGGRTAIAPDAAVQPIGVHISISDFWFRRARWVRLRKYMVTSATLVEPFTDCFFGTFFFSWVYGLSWLSTILLCIVWAAVDYTNYRILLGYVTERPQDPLKWVMTWLVRETVAFPLWAWAMSGRRIYWRDKPYQIRHDLVAEPLDY